MKIEPFLHSKILEVFHPEYYFIENQSAQHFGPGPFETHFKIVIVSNVFDGLKSLQRHRIVQEKLELNKIKASSLSLFTSKEWVEAKGEFTDSPSCMHSQK
jgi:BolA protein